MAANLGVTVRTLSNWHRDGLLEFPTASEMGKETSAPLKLAQMPSTRASTASGNLTLRPPKENPDDFQARLLADFAAWNRRLSEAFDRLLAQHDPAALDPKVLAEWVKLLAATADRVTALQDAASSGDTPDPQGDRERLQAIRQKLADQYVRASNGEDYQ